MASVPSSGTPTMLESSPGGVAGIAPAVPEIRPTSESSPGALPTATSPNPPTNSGSSAGSNGAGSEGADGNTTGNGGANDNSTSADDSGSNATGSDGAGGSATGSDGAGSNATGSDGAGGSATGSDGAGGSATGSDGAGGSATGPAGSEEESNGDVVLSAGCNVADGPDTLTAGGSSVPSGLPTSTRLSINSGGMTREYIVDIPEGYDPAHPYRLIFSWHQAYGSAEGNANGLYPANNGPNFDAESYAFFGLHRVATEADDPVIFVAPQGIGNFPWDYDRDVVLFDDLLALVTENLCIDQGRVFTTGFSFGAMMSHALSLGRASKLRGAVTMAAANYNFTQPSSDQTPIAYFGITGMSDGTCPWVNSDQQQTGGKYCVLTHAEGNGCTVPGTLQTAAMGSNEHVCIEFEGCQDGYPVKVCTFDGNHTPSSVSDGSAGDDGLRAFVPSLAWEFISAL